jgi:hypothetical protein
MLIDEVGVPAQHELEAMRLISWYKTAYGEEEGATELMNDLVDEYGIRRDHPEYADQRRKGCLGIAVVLFVLLTLTVWLVSALLRC